MSEIIQAQLYFFKMDDQFWKQFIYKQHWNVNWLSVFDGRTRYRDYLSDYIVFFVRGDVSKSVSEHVCLDFGYAFYSD